MATYTITPATSVFITAFSNAFDDGSAGDDTLIVQSGASLIATQNPYYGAYLSGPGKWMAQIDGVVYGNGFGIGLGPGITATSKITIGGDGQVGGGRGIEAFSALNVVNGGYISSVNSIGIAGYAVLSVTNTGSLIADSTGIRGIDELTVTNSGLIRGSAGVASGDILTLTNTGEIEGSGRGISGSATMSITNKGSISGSQDVIYGLSAITVNNSGLLDGGYGIVAYGSLDLTNTGTINASSDAVFMTDGTHSINNSGLINGDIYMTSGAGELTLTNSGTINGEIELSGADDTIVNTSNDTINGSVDLGDGDDTLTNRGTITGDVTGGMDADTINNVVKQGKKGFAGTIDGGLDLGAGNDTVTNYLKFKFTIKKKKSNGDIKKKKKTVEKSGEIDGTIDLGSGDDTFNGGNNAETVFDGAGADTLNFRGGDDTLIITNDATNDTIDGGSGVDTLTTDNTVPGIHVNLSDTGQVGGGTGFVQPIININANAFIGAAIGVNTITNFENVTATNFNDVLFGSDAANVLIGNDGDDDIYGLAGNDILEGGSDSDNLVGGAGADILTGGADADTFWFFDLGDSGTSAATRDLIEDFAADGAGGEVIDLSRIDANTNTGADDAFTFIGTNVLFGNNAGELRATFSAKGQIVEGDVDGDGEADFSFEIADLTHAILLSGVDGTDFVL